jgi:hypothetical protein
MANNSKQKPVVKKKIYRFYGFFNNISIGPKIHLNGVKIILHEVSALTLQEAFELYKIDLITRVGISDKNIQQHLIDLYYKSIKVEIIDGETVTFDEIPLT